MDLPIRYNNSVGGLLRLFCAIVLASTLAACVSSAPSVEVAPILARAPDALTRDCEPAALLPKSGLAAGQVLTFWGRDRAALTICRSRHQALAEHVRGQERAFPDR